MDPTVFTIVTESGARLAVSSDHINILVTEGKKLVTREVPIDQNLLLERVNADGKWELVVGVEYPKCE